MVGPSPAVMRYTFSGDASSLHESSRIRGPFLLSTIFHHLVVLPVQSTGRWSIEATSKPFKRFPPSSIVQYQAVKRYDIYLPGKGRIYPIPWRDCVIESAWGKATLINRNSRIYLSWGVLSFLIQSSPRESCVGIDDQHGICSWGSFAKKIPDTNGERERAAEALKTLDSYQAAVLRERSKHSAVCVRARVQLACCLFISSQSVKTLYYDFFFLDIVLSG